MTKGFNYFEPLVRGGKDKKMGFFIGFLIGLFLLFGWPIVYMPIIMFMSIEDGIRSRKENKRIDELEKETEKQWAIKRAQEEELRERHRLLRERIRAEYKKAQEKQVKYIAPDECHRSFSREEIEKFVSCKIPYIKPREDLTQVSEDDFQTVL